MMLKQLFISIVLSVSTLTLAAESHAQQTPRITWQSILNTPLFDTGLVRFGNADIAFAPKQPGPASLIIKTPTGEEIASYSFYDSYRNSYTVFAEQVIANLSERTFTPGIYGLQYSVAGQVVTQFVFKVEAGPASGDPFNPKTSVRFIGPWQQYGYLRFPSVRDFGRPDGAENVETVKLNFWAGAQDKAADLKKGNIYGRIVKDGKVIAHTKKTQGFIGNKYLEEQSAQFYEPHAPGTERNAHAFTKEQLLSADGIYQFALNFQENGKILRGFEVEVKNGEMVALPETSLTFEKGHQIIIPQVRSAKGGNLLFEPAFWIKAPQK